MKTIAPVALGLPLLLGLIAWRSWEHREASPPPALRPPARATPRPEPARVAEPELARVGSRTLTPRRLALWKAIDGLRSGGAPEDDEAMLVLEQDLKGEIAARAFGIHPSPADLESTLRRLAADANAAATLAGIEALFDGDRRSFLEEFVAPAFIETELWTRFRDDAEIHRGARVAAEDLASRARQNPNRFQTLGSADDLFERSRIALFPAGSPISRLELPLDVDALAQVPAGQVYPTVVETAEAFVVVRVGRRRGGLAELETWSIPKTTYSAWLTDRAREVERTIFSPAIRVRVHGLAPEQWLRQVFR